MSQRKDVSELWWTGGVLVWCCSDTAPGKAAAHTPIADITSILPEMEVDLNGWMKEIGNSGWWIVVGECTDLVKLGRCNQVTRDCG